MQISDYRQGILEACVHYFALDSHMFTSDIQILEKLQHGSIFHFIIVC